MVYLHGFLLGISLITALGPQNIFLIKQGIMKNHSLLSALICFLCDAILISGSVAGLHHLLKVHPLFHLVFAWFGVVFLGYYGYKSLRNALFTSDEEANNLFNYKNRRQIILMALGFSLLNPHAIIDSLIIIGGGSSQFPNHPYAFLMGVITSSFLWFSTLPLITSQFSDVLSQKHIWRTIEGLSGGLMLYIGAKLAFYALSL